MNEDSLESVLSLANAAPKLGESYPGRYIARYVKEIGCRTVVVERNYIDKDYLMDYATYHCRSFKDPGKRVSRLHFFKNAFDQDEFLDALTGERFGEICGGYLGFSIVKPIKNAEDQPIIGRTILETYPLSSDDGRVTRFYIANEQKANLFGQRLTVRSVPFQVQDGQVCKCATVALWSASHALSSLFGTPTHSPSDITVSATSYPSIHRRFPSEGLILEQMMEYIKSLGLEKDVMTFPHSDARLAARDVSYAKTAIKAYVQAQIPVIATVKMFDDETQLDYHAIVITGFGIDKSGNLLEIYVHDDQVGPYCRAQWQDESREIHYEWTNVSLSGGFDAYEHCQIDKLIVPVYTKIRLPSAAMAGVHEQIRKEVRREGLMAKLLYQQVGDYKAFVASHPCVNKTEILLKDLPRFLAVVRTSYADKPILDYVYDATANTVRKSKFLAEAKYE